MRTRNLRKVNFVPAVAMVVAPTILGLMLGGTAPQTRAAAPFGGAIVQVNQVTQNSQAETTIAINPTNPRNLVAGSITYETGDGQCAAYSSTDRGKTWMHQVLPNAPNFNDGGDPSVAFDANGTAYYLCMDDHGTTGGTPNGRTQYMWRSTDGGQNWVGPVLAIGSPATFDDKGHLAVDARPGSPYLGNVYAVATRDPCGSGELRFARSTDSGLSFQPDQKINDAAAIAFSGNIAIGADGAVYVSWGEVTPCPPPPQVGSITAIMIDKSTNGGQSFGALAGGTDHAVRIGDIVEIVRPVGDNRAGASMASLGAHPTDPNIVYAVWAEDPAGIDDSDVMFSRSLDGGNTWSSPIRVNDDGNPAGEFFSQFWPTMAVDPSDGEIDIVWYSDQNDPNRNDNTALVDVYFTSSTDDGLSFSPSVRLTPSSSTYTYFFGDYIDIDSRGRVAHPIWTDTTFFTDNDQNVATTQVGGADLRISKDDSPDPVAAGGQLVYTINVTNDGPADAFDVIVVDTLPNGVTFTGSTDNCTQGPSGTLTCSLGVLQSGATTSFDVRVRVDEDLVFNAGGSVTITNTATVNSDQDDPDFSNNIASEDTLVKAEVDVAIVDLAAVAPPAEVLIGQAVDLTLRKVITNHGPSSPVDVAVSRTAAAPPGSSVTPSVSSETAPAVAKDELRTIDETFTTTCGTPGMQTFSFGNAIQPANPADVDPDLTNNTASIAVTVECVVPVTINIKPGSFPNSINPKNNGVIPIAILTTSKGEYGTPFDFDASSIDPYSVRFGPFDAVWAGTGGAFIAHKHGHLEDSKELDETTMDGDLDLVLHFRTKETGIEAGDVEACAKGAFAGVGGAVYHFFGCDLVRIVPPPYDPSQVVANFFAHDTTGSPPLTVQFINNSAAPAGTTWHWDFGDGSTSTAANPVHTYNAVGTYTVILIATGPSNTDTLVRTNLITIAIKSENNRVFIPLILKEP